jgi:hypothetical protein
MRKRWAGWTILVGLAALPAFGAEPLQAPGSWNKSVSAGREAVFEVRTMAGTRYEVNVTGSGKFDPALRVEGGGWLDHPTDPAAVERGEIAGTGYSVKVSVRGSGNGAGAFALEIRDRGSAHSSGSTPAAGGGGQPLFVGAMVPGNVDPGGESAYELTTVPGETYQITVSPRPGDRFDAVVLPRGAKAVDAVGQDLPEQHVFTATGTSYPFAVAGRGGGMGFFDVSVDRYVATLVEGRRVAASVSPGRRATFRFATENGLEYRFRVLTRLDPRFDPVLALAGGAPEDQNAAGQGEAVHFVGDGSTLTAEINGRNLAGGRFEVEFARKAELLIPESKEQRFAPAPEQSFEFETKPRRGYIVLLTTWKRHITVRAQGKTLAQGQGPFFLPMAGSGEPVRFSVAVRPDGKRSSVAFSIRVHEDVFAHDVLAVGQRSHRCSTIPVGSSYRYKFFAEKGLKYMAHVTPDGATDTYIGRIYRPFDLAGRAKNLASEYGPRVNKRAPHAGAETLMINGRGRYAAFYAGRSTGGKCRVSVLQWNH